MSEENINRKIIEYIRQGKTMGQISKILNYPRSYIAEFVMELTERGVDLSRDNKLLDFYVDSIKSADEIDKKILELGQANLNQVEIARELNVSRPSITNRLKKMKEAGIEIPKNEELNETDKQILQMLEEGLSQNEIAKKFGVSKQRISQRIKKMQKYDMYIEKIDIAKCKEMVKRNEKISKQNQQILQMIGQGLSQTETAKKLGLSYSIVRDRIKKMEEKGIKIPKIPYKRSKRKIDEIDKKIIELRQQGLSQNEIGCRLNLSQTRISKRLSKIKKEGIEIPDILKPKGKKPLGEIDMQVIQMKKEGFSQGEIARKIGVCQQAVSQRMKRIREVQDLEKDKINEKTAKYVNLSKEEIEKAILNLAKTRKATFEQMQTIAKDYDIDLSRTLYFADIEER